MKKFWLLGVIPLVLASCSAERATSSADLTVALSVASTAMAVYAAQPGANAGAVAEGQRLLAAAQAAADAWAGSGLPTDKAVAQAAIAALESYEDLLGSAPQMGH